MAMKTKLKFISDSATEAFFQSQGYHESRNDHETNYCKKNPNTSPAFIHSTLPSWVPLNKNCGNSPQCFGIFPSEVFVRFYQNCPAEKKKVSLLFERTKD